MTKPVEAITVRFSAHDAMRLNDAAATLRPPEATRAKQIKRIIDAYPQVCRERREFWDRAKRCEQALAELYGSLHARAEAMEAVGHAEAALAAARAAAADILDDAVIDRIDGGPERP